LRAVIFANGALTDPEAVLDILLPEDLLLAANGGARHCLALQLTPAVIIGDCDSLNDQELKDLLADGAQLVRHSTHKDQTDLELALDYALAVGAQEMIVFGAVGGRWDQSLANLMLAAVDRFADVVIELIDGPQRAQVLRGGDTLTLQGAPGDTVSLIPLCDTAHGITAAGLEYPLEGDTLPFGTTRGISNSFTGKKVEIHLEAGLLICVQIHGSLAAFEQAGG
jgi:thiamine pyrophosphokinase